MTILWFLLGYFLLSLAATAILWASCVAAKRGDALLLRHHRELSHTLSHTLSHESQTGVTFVVAKA